MACFSSEKNIILALRLFLKNIYILNCYLFLNDNPPNFFKII